MRSAMEGGIDRRGRWLRIGRRGLGGSRLGGVYMNVLMMAEAAAHDDGRTQRAFLVGIGMHLWQRCTCTAPCTWRLLEWQLE
jgi:hypothetical protein